MAITVHQTKYAGRQANVGSIPVTFDSNPTAGRAVLVGVWNFNGAINPLVSVTDNQGGSNIYTLAINNTISPGSNLFEVGIYHCLSIVASGAFTLTLNCSGGNSNYPNIAVMEVSGLLSSGALDQTGSEDNTSGTDASPSTSGATTQAEEIAIGVVAVDTVSTGSVDATSYTNFGEEEDGASWLVGAASYRILSSIGVETATFSHPDGGNTSAIATYKSAVTGSKTLTLLGAG